tara:strand:- start:51365 stop:52102 length:738 start_codon:yes stop_codon:yes gene_type:complete
MGVELFEVGGSIRDEFLGLKNSDRDFVAVCPSGWDGLLEWAEDELDKLFLVTPEFFTIRGIKDKEVFDIVMARKEGAYSDGRHPDSVEPGTLEDDLARRDFTMNAIARSVSTGDLFDPFGGREDIQDRVIRCVGNSAERVEEDALRIMRALRFFLTKDLDLDYDLTAMLRENVLVNDSTHYESRHITSLLKSVSRERIREELHKIFKHDSLVAARVLFNEDFVASELQEAFLGEDIWLKPSMGRK